MIKFTWHSDSEMRYFGAFDSVVIYEGWLEPGYVINCYWFATEIVKWWDIE